MPARLQTLGRLRLLDKGGEDILFPEKALLILCYMHARGLREIPRADIAALFWDDAQPGAAYANLRQTLSRVHKRQREIGRVWLSFDDMAVMRGPDPLESDIEPVRDGAGLATLAPLLREDFLKYVKPTTRGLESWIALQRQAHIGFLRRAVLAEVAGGQSQGLAAAALRLLEADPGDEEIRALLTGRAQAPAGHAQAAARAIVPMPAGDAAALPARRSPPRVVLLPPATAFASRAATRFSEALIEDVTIGLCNLRSISIIAPHTAAQISLAADKAATYSRHTISYVLETRLRDEGGRHTLFAQLIFFGSDEIIWAERFSLASDGLWRARQTISAEIAGAIASRIERNELTRDDYEQDAVAYRSFLAGQSLLKNLDLRDVRRARRNFRAALQADSGFAPALGGLARSYFLEWLVTARGDGELLRQAEVHAREAVRMDDGLPSAYRELGVVKLYQLAYDESIAHLERAEAMSPHYANVIASHADTLVQASQIETGLQKIKHAIELNPLAPDEYFRSAAGASYSLGHYDVALDYIGRMQDRSPAHRLSAACWAMLGNTRKARQFVRKTLEANPNFDVESWITIVPMRQAWQRQHYYDGLKKAGF